MWSFSEFIGFIAIAGWLFIAWLLWGRLARKLGTDRLRLIGWIALVGQIFRR